VPDSFATGKPMGVGLTVLCLASYYKGIEFLQECKRQGCRTLLLTSQSLEHANWPRESLDDIFYVPDVDKTWKLRDVLLGISHLAKTEVIDRIVPLDDFDVETAAALREHLRVPGMGDTTARYFRDKLAMRTKARDAGLAVPEFIHVLNRQKLRDFMQRVPPPWVLKPRSLAGSIGVKKISSADEFWSAVTSSRFTCWSNTFLATSSTSTQSPMKRSCSSPSPASTGVLPWRLHMKATSSPRARCLQDRPTKLHCVH